MRSPSKSTTTVVNQEILPDRGQFTAEFLQGSPIFIMDTSFILFPYVSVPRDAKHRVIIFIVNITIICTCHDTIAALTAIIDHLHVTRKVYDNIASRENERQDHQHHKNVLHGHLERSSRSLCRGHADAFRIPFLHTDAYIVISYQTTRSDKIIVAIFVIVHAHCAKNR